MIELVEITGLDGLDHRVSLGLDRRGHRQAGPPGDAIAVAAMLRAHPENARATSVTD